MKIQTGQGTIPLITLIGIFSISALNALPGLAVSPILGDLNKIDREGEQSVVVASRIDYFRSKRHTLPVVR